MEEGVGTDVAFTVQRKRQAFAISVAGNSCDAAQKRRSRSPFRGDRRRQSGAGCQSWEDSKVILAEEALHVVALGRKLYVTRSDRPAEYLNIDRSGITHAGYAPETK